MADVNKNVNINVNADDALDVLNKIKTALDTTNENLNKMAETGPKVEKGLKNVETGSKGVAAGFKAILASLGIIALLGKLAEMLNKNEKVAKLVGTAMNFLQIVINSVVDVVSNLWNKMTELWQSMDHTKAVISGLLTIAITPLKVGFQELKLIIAGVQLLWEKSIFGKKNPETIAALQLDIKNTGLALKKIGMDAIQAGKDVANNIGGAVSEVSNAVKEGTNIIVEGYKKWDTRAALSSAQQQANAKKYYGLIALEAQAEADRLEGEAERNRQIRDNTELDYKTRKEASENLTKIIGEQEKALIKVAEAHIGEAKANYAVEKSDESLLAIQTALNEKKKVSADIQGKYSEQQAARLGLEREEAALAAATSQVKWDAYKRQMDAEAALIANEDERYKRQRENIELQYEGDKKLLEDRKALYKEGTAEYETAATELIKIESDKNIALKKLDEDWYRYVTSNNLSILNTIQDDTMKSLQERIDANKLAQEEIINGAWASEDAQTEALRQNEVKRRQLRSEAAQQQLQNAQNAINTIQSLDQASTDMAIALQNQKLKNGEITQEQYDKKVKEIQVKQAKREKAYAISSAIINTAAAIMKIWAEVPKADFGISTILLTAAAAAAGIAQVAKIIATPIDGGGSAGGSAAASTSTSAASAPNTSFNFAPTPTTQAQPVVKTYVLGKDVTKQQELDRNIVSNGTI